MTASVLEFKRRPKKKPQPLPVLALLCNRCLSSAFVLTTDGCAECLNCGQVAGNVTVTFDDFDPKGAA